jgi:hypothetical protein
VPDSGGAAGRGLPSQSEQLVAGIRLAYCQPYVGAFFNFMLWDEPDLTRWQSGVLWRDGSHKNSYAALQHVIDETRTGHTDCARLKAAGSTPSRPAPDVLLERLEWSPTTVFSSFNEIWSFAVAARSDARFAARIARLRHTRSGWPTGKTVLRASGRLRKSRPRVVQFARTRLPPGRYRVVLRISRLHRPLLAVTRSSPVFVVR